MNRRAGQRLDLAGDLRFEFNGRRTLGVDRLAHALSGASRRRDEGNVFARNVTAFQQRPQNRTDDSRLAGAGSAGDDCEAASGHRLHRLLLFAVQGERPAFPLEQDGPLNGLIRQSEQILLVCQSPQPFRNDTDGIPDLGKEPPLLSGADILAHDKLSVALRQRGAHRFRAVCPAFVNRRAECRFDLSICTTRLLQQFRPSVEPEVGIARA